LEQGLLGDSLSLKASQTQYLSPFTVL
jgi:hypothetical protein